MHNFVVPLNFREQAAVALVVGCAVNSLLPARLGELFRADFCKRQYGVKRSLVLGTIAIERLMDGIFVVTALVIGIVFARALQDRHLARLARHTRRDPVAERGGCAA